MTLYPNANAGNAFMPSGRRRVLLWIVAFFVLAGAAWLIFGHKKESDSTASGQNGHESHGGKNGKNTGPMPVGVATAKTGNIPIYLNGLGTVTPRNTVTVHSRVDGQLMRLPFKEGQLVKEGDLLAELDVRPYEATLVQAQGALMRDEALLAEAKIDLERYKILFAQDSIAKQQLDTQAALVKQDEGAVKIDQGQVENGQAQVDYTKITSPVSGRVGLRQVDPGNIVHAADTNGIIIVTQLQPITVIFPLPEDNIPEIVQRLQSGVTLPVEAWDRDNKTKLAEGTLLATDNQVDTTTGTVKFKAEFPNENNVLFPSQFVNARMLLNTLQDVTLIPAAAIQRGTQGTFVYLVKDDSTVAVQPVTLGVTEGDTASISKGLKAGDVVVVDGSDNLREGAKIEVAAKDGQPVEKPAGEEASKDGKAGDQGGQESGQESGKRHHRHKHGDDEGANKGASSAP